MAQIKVMCLGDSLTAGDDLTSGSWRTYRGRLFQQLVAAGYDVNFVGTQQRQPAVGGDPDHEGYGGIGVDTSIGGVAGMSSRLSTIFAANTPDVIVVLIGWNDVFNVPTNLADRYASLVAAIEAATPTAKLLLCTLPPLRGQTETQTNSSYAAYQSVNARIRTLANASGSDRRYLADIAGLASSTDLSTWVQGLVDDMRLQPDFWNGAGITAAGGGAVQGAWGGIEAASYAGMLAANSLWSTNPPNPGNGAAPVAKAPQSDGPGHPRFINGARSIVPWAWAYAAAGHSSSNTGVEQRNMFAASRRSSGQWVFMFSGARTWGSVWSADGSALQRLQPDGITTFVKPAGNAHVEAWARDTVPSRGIVEFFGGFNREAIADGTCFVAGVQMRLALDNPSGPNDMAQSRIIVKCGYDIFSDVGGEHYDWLGFPRNAMDGGSGRWKHLTSTQWVWVTTTSADMYWGGQIGVPPPWGFWNAPWPYAYAASGYAITEQQLRANPPPLPPFRESTGTVGSGFVTGDYADALHMYQSGADKMAQVMFDALVAHNMLTPGAPPPPTSGNILQRPRAGRWRPKAQSGRANWRVSSSESFTPPQLTTGSYPAVVRNVAFSAASSATGTAPIAWSATGLPSGLSMDPSSGTITGTTSAAAGAYTVTITLTNEGAPSGVSFTRTITVAEAPSPPSIITPETIPGVAVRNQFFSYGLKAEGSGPFTWSVQGNMPSGFELLADGTVRGIGRTSGVYSFIAQVTGANGLVASRVFTLRVSNAPGDRWVRVGGGVAVWVRVP